MSQENKSFARYYGVMNFIPYSGKNLTIIREDIGLSRKQVAELSGRTETSIGQLEREERKPSFDQMIAMSDILSEHAQRKIILYPEPDQAVVDSYSRYRPGCFSLKD